MKQFLFFFFSLLLAGLILLSGCKKDTATDVFDLGYGYFPDKAGHYVIYDVDSIVHNDFTQKTDTFKFQVKELIASIYYDNQNRPTQRLERYKRKNSAAAWELKDVWWANLTKTTAEKVEEDIRYIKLHFPVKKDETWNGNVQNTQGEWNYKYTNVNIPMNFYTVTANLDFDSTATVLQRDDENLIEKKYYKEIYAKNVGLILKQIIDVSSQNVSSGKPLMQRIEKGLEYKMTVNAYGN